MKYAILLSALSISFVAAYFSIVGLTAMFPAAFWSIVIMGSVLEVAKLVSASWLHHNWKICPRSLKIYLTTAVVVLVFITSMGIFGYLSKSYITHQTVAEETKIILSQLDDKIQREQDYIQRQNEYLEDLDKQKNTSTTNIVYNIELEQKKIDDLYSSLDKNLKIDNDEITRLNSRLKVLDEEVALLNAQSGGLFSSKKKKLEELTAKQKLERDEIKSKLTSAESRINKARGDTESQVKLIRAKIDERQNDTVGKEDLSLKKEEYNQNIQGSYAKIEAMEAEKFTHKNSQLEIEAEVGPVKYVAELLEDLGAQSIALAEAIRIIIVILIFVFDPLAVVMLLAANMSFKIANGKPYDKLSDQIKKKKVVEHKTIVKEVDPLTDDPKPEEPAKAIQSDEDDITEIKILK
ncbi:MAG: hypothetical protein CL885_03675 [Dehalococcoidia bacterium]|nr:hypothetical protein [Dehalococcoidia bacterium]